MSGRRNIRVIRSGIPTFAAARSPPSPISLVDTVQLVPAAVSIARARTTFAPPSFPNGNSFPSAMKGKSLMQ